VPVKIYIPLCPYFNHEARIKADSEKFIYIPLCPYFNKRIEGRKLPLLCIYIPLCPYFNLLNIKTSSCSFIFTFHYVPISTEAVIYRFIILVVFTFHYVPISTGMESQQALNAYIIYIPLCPYFNPL